MTTVTTPTSELEAVNLMLAVIGESPLSSLAETSVVDAVLAQQTLSEVSREVQTKGWHFNTEIDFPLQPSIPSGEIRVPSNCLKIDTTGKDAGIDVVHRGGRLYDRKRHTYSFPKGLLVEMVIALPFDELPQSARHYIAVKAARVFQGRTVGSDSLYQFSARDEQDARVALQSAEAQNSDHNMLTDSWSVARILQRK